MAVYRRGSKGTEVENIQTWLKQLEPYKGSADRKFGAGTEKAVKAFQRARQLEVDGKVGPATWKEQDVLCAQGRTAEPKERSSPRRRAGTAFTTSAWPSTLSCSIPWARLIGMRPILPGSALRKSGKP
jgi:hypothetical protein